MKTMFLCVIMLGVGFLTGQYLESHKSGSASKAKPKMNFGAPVEAELTPDVAHKADKQIEALHDYIRKNFADPNAEIVTVSEPVVFQDFSWRTFRVRGKNAMGGPAIEEHIAMYAEDYLVELYSMKKLDLLPKRIKDDFTAFSEAIAHAKEIDLTRK